MYNENTLKILQNIIIYDMLHFSGLRNNMLYTIVPNKITNHISWYMIVLKVFAKNMHSQNLHAKAAK